MEIKKIQVNGRETKVLQHIPIMQKIELIDMILQKSTDAIYVNPLKREAYFNLYVSSYYSDYPVDEGYELSWLEVYDDLKQAKVFDDILKAIPREELEEIQVYVNSLSELRNRAMNSIGAVVYNLNNAISDSVGTVNDLATKLDTDQVNRIIKMLSSQK